MNCQRCLWYRGELGVLAHVAFYGLTLGLSRVAPNGQGISEAIGNRPSSALCGPSYGCVSAHCYLRQNLTPSACSAYGTAMHHAFDYF